MFPGLKIAFLQRKSVIAGRRGKQFVEVVAKRFVERWFVRVDEADFGSVLILGIPSVPEEFEAGIARTRVSLRAGDKQQAARVRQPRARPPRVPQVAVEATCVAQRRETGLHQS